MEHVGLYTVEREYKKFEGKRKKIKVCFAECPMEGRSVNLFFLNKLIFVECLSVSRRTLGK
jgi:hypothetical protein